MTTVWIAAIAAVLVSMLCVVLRALLGPSSYDRILATNVFGTNTVVMIALLGYLTGTAAFLDVALIYALINFVTTVAFLRYFQYGAFGEE